MFCWDCKYFNYDEIYDSETGNEWQLADCLKDQDLDEIKSYKDCPLYEDN